MTETTKDAFAAQTMRAYEALLELRKSGPDEVLAVATELEGQAAGVEYDRGGHTVRSQTHQRCASFLREQAKLWQWATVFEAELAARPTVGP